MYSFFVSSTFRDMQGERDAIHRIVLPQLRDLAAKYGQAVQFVDLRWGVSTSELEADEAQRKVLEVCLHEIDSCVPYMIVLLGERYGWAPGSRLIRESAHSGGFRPDSNEISVTELEIQYGIWKNEGRLDRVLFCFRDPVPAGALTEEEKGIYLSGSEEDRRKMERLKAKIRSNPTANIYEYCLEADEGGHKLGGYDAFAEEITGRLSKMLRESWGEPRVLSWQEKQQQEDRLRCEMLRSSFVGLKKTRARIAQSVRENSLTILEGEGGSGKSAMLSILSEDLADEYRTEMIYCGGSDYCMTTEQLLNILLYRLRGTDDAAEIPDTPETGEADDAESVQAAREAWNRACASYEGDGIVFFIDAIDQLMPDEGLAGSWFIPTKIAEPVRIVCSTTGAVRISQQVLDRTTDGKQISCCQLRLHKADEAERRAIIRVHFEKEHKQIGERVLDRMMKHPLSENMLCMDIMIRWLLMLGAHDFARIAVKEKEQGDGGKAIEEYLLEQIGKMPDTVQDLIREYLFRIGRFLTDSDENEWGDDFYQTVTPLLFISATSHGLTRDQLRRIQELFNNDDAFKGTSADHVLRRFWDETRFARMRAFMGTQLIEREDGRVDLAHRLIKAAVREIRGTAYLASSIMVFLDREPVSDETRTEDLLPVSLLYLSGCRDDPPEKRAGDVAFSSAFAQHVISDLGNMSESDDPETAAQGETLYQRMLQSTAVYLVRAQDWSGAADDVCDIISHSILEGNRHFYWLISFFSNALYKELRKHSGKGKDIALRLILHTARSFCAKGKENGFADWTDAEKKRQLLLQQNALSTLNELAGRLWHRKLPMGRQAASYETIRNDFDEYNAMMRRWFPNSFIVWYRIANMSCSNAMYESLMNSRYAGHYTKTAEKLVRQLGRIKDSGFDEKRAEVFRAFLLLRTANCLYIISRSALREKYFLKEADAVTSECLASVEGLKDDRKNQDIYLGAVLQKGRILYGMDKTEKGEALLQQTYSRYKDTTQMTDASRVLLARIGIEMGYEALMMYRRTGRSNNLSFFREIILREETYLASAPQDNHDDQFCWQFLRIMKTVMLPDEQVVEKTVACRQIRQELSNLLADWDDTEEYTKEQLKSQIDYMDQQIRDGEGMISRHRVYYLLCQGDALAGRNPEEALAYFQEAAATGDPDALCRMGYVYYRGEGVDENPIEALRCWKQAAKGGSVTAMFNTGVILYNEYPEFGGREEGMEWIRRAAEKGHKRAQEALEKAK